jgi:hypothetical protein
MNEDPAINKGLDPKKGRHKRTYKPFKVKFFYHLLLQNRNNRYL